MNTLLRRHRGALAAGDPLAPAMGMFPHAYMWGLGVLIAGGTANIQRNIIAERGLGMPRDTATQSAARRNGDATKSEAKRTGEMRANGEARDAIGN